METMANIYMIEDDLDYADVVIKVMKSMGHTVEVESDPAKAIPRLKAKRPDLIILDVMFPEDSFAGLELARTLKDKAKDLKDIPILLLTAVNEKYSVGFSNLDIDNSFFPVSDFLDKSVDLDVLKNKVTKLLEEGAGKK
jgi:CheY-like chemotaxis protein